MASLMRQVPAPAPPPGTPAPSTLPAPVVAGQTPVAIQAPGTEEGISALRAKRSELSNQLSSAVERRNSVARQLERADGAARVGLEQRLSLLDKRILQLETDISENGRLLAQAPISEVTASPPYRIAGMKEGNFVALSVVFMLVVLMPMAVAAARLMLRRAAKPVMPPGWADASQRLERMEQAVDTIAIEIERVTEGQRFITKIMSDRGALSPKGLEQGPRLDAPPPPLPALGAGSPEQVPLKQAEKLGVRRG